MTDLQLALCFYAASFNMFFVSRFRKDLFFYFGWASFTVAFVLTIAGAIRA